MIPAEAMALATQRVPADTAHQVWLEQLRSEAISFLEGDNNSPWAILAETAIGCVPILGQIVDARDVIKGLRDVSEASASSLAWFMLFTALIGLIPGGGDAVKRGLRVIKADASHLDELLDVIRRFGKGDPEKAIKDLMNPSRLQKSLNDILGNPHLLERLSPELRGKISRIRQDLSKRFEDFKTEVDEMLGRGRKTSAEAPSVPKRAETPPAKPGTQAKAGTKAEADAADAARAKVPNASEIAQRTLKRLSAKALGVLGEHMADYHCQDEKRWGVRAPHDQGKLNLAKLNDASRLVQLWPPIPRGRGIDGVWKRSNGAKPYAIIEAKCSYNPLKSLRALLADVGDKSGRDAQPAPSTTPGRKGRSGRTSAPPTQSQSGSPRAPGLVMQMSHAWILQRLKQAAGIQLELAIKRDGYTRHVLFFSIPQAVSHAQVGILHLAGKPVDITTHGTHQVTREWLDNEIEKEADRRQGYAGPARDSRTR